MHCNSCALLIDDAVEDLEGVTSSTTNLRTGTTDVYLTTTDPSEILAAITSTGYSATLAAAG